MGEKRNIINDMESYAKDLEIIIAKREKIIRKMPKGRLKCYMNGKGYSWYKVMIEKGNNERAHSKRTRLNKKNQDLAEMLAIKGFHEEALRVEKRRLRAIELFLKYYDTDIPGAKYLEKNEEYRRLAASAVKQGDYSIQEVDWMNQERLHEQPHPEALIVATTLGYNVRSKSEAEYVAVFEKYGIVFRYEWPIVYDDYPYPIFPDFTILNPNTGETYILEHLGRMDDEKYVRENSKKIEMYFRHGLYPGMNLFLSYETSERKFTSLDAEEIVKNEILPKINSSEKLVSKEAYWI